MLDHEDRVRRDRCIPRDALQKFKYSSFKYLYSSGNNQALLNATGYDHQAFDLLLGKFKATYEFHMVCKRTGRIRRKNER